MVQLLNTLYVSEHGALVRAEGRALVVHVGRERRARFPLTGLDAVVLTGKATMTTDAIGRCVDAGVRVAALKATGRLRFAVSAPSKGNVLLRVAQQQARADGHRKLQLARAFVAGKLQNFRRVIGRWSSDDDARTRSFLDAQRRVISARLDALTSARTGDAIRGIEGDATRRYFKAMGAHLQASRTPFEFQQRTRRPPRDPVNALLSYVYGLLLVEVIGALEAVGLDPQIGYLHDLRPGRPSLALDLVEELRPAIADRFTVGVLTRRMISFDAFVVRAGGACYLSDAGRRSILDLWARHRSGEVVHRLLDRVVARSQLPTLQAGLLARHLRGDLPAYPPFVLV